VTADGETIIKKRSRTVSVKSKQNFGAPKFGLGSESWTDSPPQLGKSPGPDLSNVGDARKIGLVDQKLFEAVIRRHSDMNRGPVIADEYQVTGNSESSSTQFLLPQVGHGESGVAAMSFGLFDPSLCDAASSTTTTTTTSPTTTKVETTHQVLPTQFKRLKRQVSFFLILQSSLSNSLNFHEIGISLCHLLKLNLQV